MKFDDIREPLQRDIETFALRTGVPTSNLQEVVKDGRRRIAGRRVLAVSIALSIATGAVAAARMIDFAAHEKTTVPAGSTLRASSVERAGVFAIRAVAAAGLADSLAPGIYADYEDTVEVDSGWESTFTIVTCDPTSEGFRCQFSDDGQGQGLLTLAVEELDGQLQVVEIAGPVSEEQRTRLSDYSESADSEIPALEALAFSVMGQGEHRSLVGKALWTGPMPFDGLASCKTQLLDGSDAIVNEGDIQLISPPSGRGDDEDDEEVGEAARDERLIWPPLEIPSDVKDPQGRYVCDTGVFSPRENVETIIDSSNGYELSEFSIQHLSPVEDPDSTTLARIHYGVAWPEDHYPGARRCKFTLYGSDDTELGSTNEVLEEIGPQASGYFTDVDVDTTAGWLAISCEPERIDDPDGRFSFSDIKLVRDNYQGGYVEGQVSEGDAASQLKVVATRAWDGGALPAWQSCVVRLLGRSGDVLLAQEFTMHADGTERREGIRTFRDDPGLDAAERAEIECTPIISR